MIVGTAGHIDHGKTSLVRALTGVDTDRLKEEKARGISIELGYAYTPLPDGGVLGFIDVPGHERFIHTMLAGATGIDAGLLVVAADDSVMPQTREHLDILDLLGVREGLIVITKCDRVDAQRIAAVREDIAHAVAATALATWPVVVASSADGRGLDDIRARLHALAARPSRPTRDEGFRLAIDRSFTLPGVGTVVTGTVFAGEVRVGDTLVVAPLGSGAAARVRVRGIHAQNRDAERGHRGQRCAIALAGIDRETARRGDWLISDWLHAPTERLDVALRLLAHEAKALAHNTRVHVHLGAAHTMGRVALLEGERLEPGARMRAQLVLDAPTHAVWGDLCVIRDAAASRTLGGARVLDPDAPARYRRSPARLAELDAWAAPDDLQALEALLVASPHGVSLSRFARVRNRVAEHLAVPATAVRIDDHLFSSAGWTTLQERLLERITHFHDTVPDELGPLPSRLRRMAFATYAPEVVEALARSLVAEGRLATTGPWLHLPGRTVHLTPEEEAMAPALQAAIARAAEPVWVRDLSQAIGHDEAAVRRVMLKLMKRGELLQVVRDLYLSLPLARRYADWVCALDVPPGQANAARFRDVSGLGRKRAIQVLECFDRIGYTRRLGDAHRVRVGANADELFGRAQ